jgi:hypothetical protein
MVIGPMVQLDAWVSFGGAEASARIHLIGALTDQARNFASNESRMSGEVLRIRYFPDGAGYKILRFMPPKSTNCSRLRSRTDTAQGRAM